jgi:hypothetical protein
MKNINNMKITKNNVQCQVRVANKVCWHIRYQIYNQVFNQIHTQNRVAFNQFFDTNHVIEHVLNQIYWKLDEQY